MSANIVLEIPIDDEALALRLERLAPPDRLGALVAARLAEVCHTAQAVVPPQEASAPNTPALRRCVTPCPLSA